MSDVGCGRSPIPQSFAYLFDKGLQRFCDCRVIKEALQLWLRERAVQGVGYQDADPPLGAAAWGVKLDASFLQ